MHRVLSHKITEERYRMISKMPVWSRAVKDGEAVKSPFTMNIPLRKMTSQKDDQPTDPMPRRVSISGS